MAEMYGSRRVVAEDRSRNVPIQTSEIYADDCLEWMRCRDITYAFGTRRNRKTTTLLQCMRDDAISNNLDLLSDKKFKILFFGNSNRQLSFAQNKKDFPTGEKIVQPDIPVEWVSLQSGDQCARGIDKYDYVFMYFDDAMLHENEVFKILNKVVLPLMELEKMEIKIRFVTTGKHQKLFEFFRNLPRIHPEKDIGVCEIVRNPQDPIGPGDMMTWTKASLENTEY